MANSGKSSSFGLLLLLLLALVAAGGWNYHKNYQAEMADRTAKPFAGYDTSGLQQLAGAYRAEIDGMHSEYQQLRGARSAVRNTQGVREGVKQFERVQRNTKRLREITEELATREARVREIEEELAHRERLAGGLAVHFERLTGYPLPI